MLRLTTRRLAIGAAFCLGLAMSLSAFSRGSTPEECARCWDDCIASYELCRSEGGGSACFTERRNCINRCGCRG